MLSTPPNYTQLSVSSYSGGGFNVGCGTCALANFDINTYQLADDFTLIRGKHQIVFGFDGRKDQFNSYNNQQSNGQFTFNGGITGDGLADLLIGRFDVARPDRRKRDFRLPAPDGHRRLRAGLLPRHAAFHHQLRRPLGTLRAVLR